LGNELATVPISALCFELLNLVARLGAKVHKNNETFALTGKFDLNKF